jgi:MATE family multidrug resistance protein
MSKHPHREIWAIAGPAILANSSAPLVGLVDTWAIGHLPGAVHLAAVGLGSVIFSYLLWAFGFLRMCRTRW